MREHILRVKNDDKFALIMTGNKADLEDQRRVSTAEAQAQATRWGVPYVETSAKTKDNVDKAFFDLMRMVKATKGEPAGGQGKKNKKKKKSKCTIL